MAAADMIRLLDPSEALYVGMGLSSGFSVRVHGSLDLLALSDAFDALRESHPVLGAQLRIGSHNVALVEPLSLPSALTVIDGNVETQRIAAELDSSRAVCELHVVRQGREANVTLLVHHCIADGPHLMALLVELWSHYTDIVADRPVSITRHDYPLSMEALFAARGIGGDFASDMAHVMLPTADTTRPSVEPVIHVGLRCTLGEHATATLTDFAHRERVTLNALVSAAIVRALSQIYHVPVDAIPYAYAVNLRTRIVPPVSAMEGTAVIGRALFTASADCLDLLDIARSINRHFAAELTEDSIHQAAMATQLSNAAGMRFRQADVSAFSTNIGTVPTLRHPPGLKHTNFRILLYRDPAAVLPSLVANMPLSFAIFSFDGRLSVDLLVSHPDDRSHAIIAAVDAELHALV